MYCLKIVLNDSQIDKNFIIENIIDSSKIDNQSMNNPFNTKPSCRGDEFDSNTFSRRVLHKDYESVIRIAKKIIFLVSI